MTENVRPFMLRTYGKIVAHYRQVLRDPGIPELERQAILNRLAQAVAKLETFESGGKRVPYVTAA